VYGALQIHKEFLILLLCPSLWNFSQCFCALLCVAKVRWKFQTVFGVWYTLQTYIKITHSSGPCHYLVYANNGRDCRLAKIFLGANDVRQHSPGGPRFFPWEGRSGCWIFAVPNLFPWNFHSVFIKFASFQYVPQVSNVFPDLFPIALTLCHILCPQFYCCNLYTKEPKGWDYNMSYLFQECSNLDLKICAELNKDVDRCVFLWRNIAKFRPKKYDFPAKKKPKFVRLPIKKFQIIRFLW
jgi:hypothetical protein